MGVKGRLNNAKNKLYYWFGKASLSTNFEQIEFWVPFLRRQGPFFAQNRVPLRLWDSAFNQFHITVYPLVQGGHNMKQLHMASIHF